MYLRDLISSCLRRWPLFVACLLLSAGLFLVASQQVKPTYQSTASIVLVPPTSAEEPSVNRYLGLSGLKQSVDVLVGSMSSEETTAALEARVPGATFTVESDVATSAPILDVTADSARPAAATRMLKAVLDQLPAKLAELQDSVDIQPDNQITQVVLSADTEPATVQRTRYRVLGVLAAALLLASALAVAAVDGLLLRRGARAARPRAEADPGEEGEPRTRTRPAPATAPAKGGRGPDRRRRAPVAPRTDGVVPRDGSGDGRQAAGPTRPRPARRSS